MMTDEPSRRNELWQQLLAQVQTELAELAGADRDWLAARLDEIANLQAQLHQLFLAADGAAACSNCQGECCARGTYHLTLANLVWLLMQGRQVPVPDFSRTCPWLGDSGCQLAVACRPYNCVTFICERIEEALEPSQKREFYRLEQQLREIYLKFSKHFSGGSLHGLLNVAERLPGRPLLRRH